MNTTTLTHATRRILIAAAVATTATLTANAATNRNWNGGTGGTEAAPLDIYDGEHLILSVAPRGLTIVIE